MTAPRAARLHPDASAVRRLSTSLPDPGPPRRCASGAEAAERQGAVAAVPGWAVEGDQCSGPVRVGVSPLVPPGITPSCCRRLTTSMTMRLSASLPSRRWSTVIAATRTCWSVGSIPSYGPRCVPSQTCRVATSSPSWPSRTQAAPATRRSGPVEPSPAFLSGPLEAPIESRATERTAGSNTVPSGRPPRSDLAASSIVVAWRRTSLSPGYRWPW